MASEEFQKLQLIWRSLTVRGQILSSSKTSKQLECTRQEFRWLNGIMRILTCVKPPDRTGCVEGPKHYERDKTVIQMIRNKVKKWTNRCKCECTRKYAFLQIYLPFFNFLRASWDAIRRQHQIESSTCSLQFNHRVQFLTLITTPRDYTFSTLFAEFYALFDGVFF